MSTQERNTRDKEKVSDFEVWFDVWSDHLMVVALFVFLVMLGIICR